MKPRHVASLGMLACSSCYSTWDIAPTELSRLQGYRAPAAAAIADKDGADVRVDEDTRLRFERKGYEPEDHRFASIDAVDQRALLGEEAPPTWVSGSGAYEPDRSRVMVDLSEVSNVQARRFSVGKTVALSVGVSVVGTAAVAGIVLAVWAASDPLGSGFSGFGGGFGSLKPPRGLEEAPRGRDARSR